MHGIKWCHSLSYGSGTLLTWNIQKAMWLMPQVSKVFGDSDRSLTTIPADQSFFSPCHYATSTQTCNTSPISNSSPRRAKYRDGSVKLAPDLITINMTRLPPTQECIFSAIKFHNRVQNERIQLCMLPTPAPTMHGSPTQTNCCTILGVISWWGVGLRVATVGTQFATREVVFLEEVEKQFLCPFSENLHIHTIHLWSRYLITCSTVVHILITSSVSPVYHHGVPPPPVTNPLILVSDY